MFSMTDGDWAMLFFFIFLILGFGYFFVDVFWLSPKNAKKKKEKELAEERAKENEEKEISKKQEQGEIAQFSEILQKYDSYIQKFCQITLREVLTKDDWGDEDPKTIPALKKECIIRIGKKVYGNNDNQEYLESSLERWFDKGYKTQVVYVSDRSPYWVKKMFTETLDKAFVDYQKMYDEKQTSHSNLDNLSGIEFETLIQSLLSKDGYSVSVTPKSGDQGADVIATKNNIVYVIQAKRYMGTVGNKAVQEVVAAKNYYAGDVAVVVTNSSFTKSAESLAKRNKVILIGGTKITNIGKLLGLYDKS